MHLYKGGLHIWNTSYNLMNDGQLLVGQDHKVVLHLHVQVFQNLQLFLIF